MRTLLVSDLVGSTRLVEELGDHGAAELGLRHDRLARDLMVAHEGLEIDKTDGFLLLFERPLDAVHYALEYHAALSRLSDEEGRRIKARVGIHLGEVMLRENPPDDVARGAKPLEVEGLAKPTCGRLMSLARGGQTLLSRGAFDVARRGAVGRLDEETLSWLSHGGYLFKGVTEPFEVFEVGREGVAPLEPPADSAKVRRVAELVSPAPTAAPSWTTPLPLAGLAVLVIAAVLAGVYAWQGQRTPPGSQALRIASLAVLPLQNLSGDPEQEYFADGMTEALITDLSKIGALKVISRTSAMRYKGTDKPLAEITRELDVDAVVEGSVAREAGRVQITAKLIEAATDQSLWAERYERELTSILTLQGEVAQAIAREVRVTLTPEEEKLLKAERAVDPEAYDAYLKGMSHWNKLTPSDLDTALQYFELVLERDPEYAPAHAGIALVWIGRQQMGVTHPQEATPQARAAATKALELDDTLAEAHSVLAVISTWSDWDWETASAEFRRALTLKPNDPHTLAYYSHYLIIVKRPSEAIAQIEKALELDPFNPLYKALYGAVLSFTGRHAEAIEEARETLRTVPNHPVALSILWGALYYEGRFAEALEAATAQFAATGEREVAAALERGQAEGDYHHAMRLAAEALADRSDRDFFPALDAVLIHVDAGDIFGALDWLERGFEIHDPSMPYLSVADFEELRKEPRFQDVLRHMNLHKF